MSHTIQIFRVEDFGKKQIVNIAKLKKKSNLFE